MPYGLQGWDIISAIMTPVFDGYRQRIEQSRATQEKLQLDEIERSRNMMDWQQQYGQEQLDRTKQYNRETADAAAIAERDRRWGLQDQETRFEQQKALSTHESGLRKDERAAEIADQMKRDREKEQHKLSFYGEWKKFVDANKSMKGQYLTPEALSALSQAWDATPPGQTADFAGVLATLESSGINPYMGGKNTAEVDAAVQNLKGTQYLRITGNKELDAQEEQKAREVLQWAGERGEPIDPSKFEELSQKYSQWNTFGQVYQKFQADMASPVAGGEFNKGVRKLGGWEKESVPGWLLMQYPFEHPEDPIVAKAVKNYGSWTGMLDFSLGGKEQIDAFKLYSPSDIAQMYAFARVNSPTAEADANTELNAGNWQAELNKLLNSLASATEVGPSRDTKKQVKQHTAAIAAINKYLASQSQTGRGPKL